MQRVTLALTDEAAERFERFIRERGYTNRSEAFRDLTRLWPHVRKAFGFWDWNTWTCI